MLDISRQGFFAWKKSKPGQRHERNVEVVKQIQQAYEDGRKTYGSPRTHRALKANNVNINEKNLAKYITNGASFSQRLMAKTRACRCWICDPQHGGKPNEH